MVGLVSVSMPAMWGMGRPDGLPNQPDTMFHLNTIRLMLDTGDASSLHAAALNSPTGSGFYPAAFHDIAVAHFGLILQQDPKVCKAGYTTKQRDPNSDRGDLPMDENARCTEPASQSNARGAQNAPRRAGPSYRAPVVGSYDRGTGEASTPTGTRAAT